MPKLSLSTLVLTLSSATLLLIACYWFIIDGRTLARPEIRSGYLLLAIMLLPALLGVRKRLSVIPLGTVHGWTRVHVVFGALLLPLFWLHLGGFWPDGIYEQILAALFYLVTAGGFAGWLMQKRIPNRLVQAGNEVIFERIPEEIIECRREVEHLILEYQKETGSDTLAKHYVDILSWYFFKPRFRINHLFSGEAHEHWLRGKYRIIERYLAPDEKKYLRRLADIARRKADLDFHYTHQGLLKLWLFLHVPLAAALVVFSMWHLLLVHLYSI
ncbi:MAG: hypothetical protein VW985_08570 [Gammaproteobacteria bacterium]